MLRVHSGVIALVLAPTLLLGAGAWAEQGVYRAFAGWGLGARFETAGAPTLHNTLLLESNFGITDQVNWHGPLLLELGRARAITLGSGLEYVYFNTNHWRLDAGVGLALRRGLFTPEPWRPVPFLKTSARWLFAWGTGASLSVHLARPLGSGAAESAPALHLYPTLALYQEFW
jgi:hypothetical protein